MSLSFILQIFLLLDVFLIGALSTIAVQHAYAHFRPRPRETKRTHQSSPDLRLTPEARDRLQKTSQAKFQAVVDQTAADLQHDLATTGAQLNTALNKLGTSIIGNELERYHADLAQIREQAETALSNAQTNLSEHQAELKTKLAEEIAAEKARLLQQVDTKLADAVASFLTETLGHNIDLGAQTAYLTAQLNEHKAEILQEVADEAPASK